MAILDRLLGWIERTSQTWRMARQLRTKGIGERVLSGMLTGGTTYGWPGGWSQDRIEQALHYKHWNFVAIRVIAQAIAGLTPNLGFVSERESPSMGRREWQMRRYQKTLHSIRPHEEIQLLPGSHPMVRLFKRPNVADTAWDFWYELVMFLQLTGNAYIWTVPNRAGKIAELWIIPSHWVWPRVGRGRIIDYYEIRPWIGPGTLKFPPEEVIHIRYKNPIHKVDGWSVQTAAAEWIDASESVDRCRFYQFKNGAFPIGALELSGEYHDPDEQELDRIYAKFFQRLQGEWNYGRPIITPPGAKYNPLMIAPTEMAYVQSAEQLRDWVLSSFGVPKEIVGLQPSGNELSWYAPLNQFCRWTLTPLLQCLAESLTEHFAVVRYGHGHRIWWDDPTPDNPDQVNKDIETDAKYLGITPNEIRALRGREPYAHGGNDPIAQMGWSPMPLNTGEDLSEYGLTPAQEENYGTNDPAPLTAFSRPGENGQRNGNDQQAPSKSWPARLSLNGYHRRKDSETPVAKTLLMVRHGKTTLNDPDPSKDRIRGWKDVPLSEEGLQEAKDAAQFLKDIPVSRIVASDLQRTQQTAEIIAAAKSMDVDEVRKEMRPWDLGDFTGELAEQVYPKIEDYVTNKPDDQVPGGESFNDFKARVLKVMTEWMDQAQADADPLLVVTHFRNMKLVQSWLAASSSDCAPDPAGDVDMDLFMEWKDMPTGVVLRLTCDEAGSWGWDQIGPEAGESAEEGADNPKGGGPKLIALPDVRQTENFDCGAAALHAVAQYFGVGPDTEEEFMELAHTDEGGTRPQGIIAAGKKLGLTVAAGETDLAGLADSTSRNAPVICPIQREGEGHYVVVIGVSDKSVYVQDPVDGPKRIGNKLWMERWHDSDEDGKQYRQYGIALAMPATKLLPVVASTNGNGHQDWRPEMRFHLPQPAPAPQPPPARPKRKQNKLRKEIRALERKLDLLMTRQIPASSNAQLKIESENMTIKVAEQAPPVVHVDPPQVYITNRVPEQDKPVVNVNVPAPVVTVKAADQPAPVVRVNVEAPINEINLPELQVINQIPEPKPRAVKVVRDGQDRMAGLVPIEDAE